MLYSYKATSVNANSEMLGRSGMLVEVKTK